MRSSDSGILVSWEHGSDQVTSVGRTGIYWKDLPPEGATWMPLQSTSKVICSACGRTMVPAVGLIVHTFSGHRGYYVLKMCVCSNASVSVAKRNIN